MNGKFPRFTFVINVRLGKKTSITRRKRESCCSFVVPTSLYSRYSFLYTLGDMGHGGDICGIRE